MADAKRCDICGGFYSLNYVGTDRPSANGGYVDGLKIMCYRHQTTLGCYDLCEKCANDLLAFIRQHKKEGDNEQ